MNWTLLQNSLLVATGSAGLALFWGLAVALWAVTLSSQVRKVIIIAAVAAFALPPFLIANSWLHYFGLAGTLRPYIPFNLFSLGGTVLLIALQLWPISFLLLLASLLRIDRVYLELDPMFAGQKLFNSVTWPFIRGAFWRAGAISFVLGLNSFSIPALLQTKVYAAEVWLSFNTQFDYWQALRLSWPLIIGPLLLLALIRDRRLVQQFRHAQFPSRLFRERLGSIRVPAALVSGAVLGLSLGLPLAQLLFSSRTWTELAPAIAAGTNATWNSLLFAFGSALLVLGLSTLLHRSRFPAVLWVLFLAPGVLLGIALIWTFNRPISAAFYSSIGIVLLAYTLRFFAFGWSGARLSVHTIDPLPVEAVHVFGGSRWQQFRLAIWPQARPLLLATFVLIYLMCLWEVETLILLVPPGRETLALRIFNMLHYGHAGQLNALCLWLLAIAVAPLLLYWAGQKLARFVLPALLLCAIGCSSSEPGTTLQSGVFKSVQVIGTRGTGAGQFNKPRSLALDREDNLYVVDLTGRVQKFSPEGLFLLSWQMPQTDKGKPKGMMQDSDGNIIVIEPHYSRINHFDPAGHLVAQWGAQGTNDGQLTFPRSAAVNSHGEIYLSEYGLVERVLRFSHHGEGFFQVIGSPGTKPGHFNRPEGLGIGPDDRLHVADSCNHRVQIFAPDGRFIEYFGRAGSARGEMSYPYDVRIDPTGLKFVCEFGNSRIQVFDSANRPVEIIGGHGAGPNQMHNPWSIALDSEGNLYVADSGNHRVLKYLRREPLKPARQTKTAESLSTMAAHKK